MAEWLHDLKTWPGAMSIDRSDDYRLIDQAKAAVCGEKASHVARDSAAMRDSLVLEGFELIREIGRGGQGIVYQAMQHSTQRYVAVKILRSGLLASRSEQARIEREVRILSQLRHPGIVSIHDSGRSGELFYIVMDYIDGEPLDVYIHNHRPSLREQIELFAHISDAVHAAHLRGVIHRDLKPGNIRIDEENRPHVLDFGLAKLLTVDTPQISLTMTGQFVGSVQWASPEQARGDAAAIDIRTDVYALGVVFWHCITGAFPYPVDGDMPRTLVNIVSVDPPRVARGATAMPFEVETILRKCLAKEPVRRYQNAGELAADFRNYLNGHPISARRDSQLYVLRKLVARHRIVVGLVAGIFLLTLISALGLGVLFVRSESSAALALQRAAELREALYYSSITIAEKAYETGNSVEMATALEQCPADLRGWEYWHLQRLTDESCLSWEAHGRGRGICYSSDGRYLLTFGTFTYHGPPRGSVRLWDALTGDLIRIVDESDSFHAACFSPTGRRLAVGGRLARFRVQEVDSAEILIEYPRVWPLTESWTRNIQYTHDGKQIVLSAGNTCYVHDAQTGAQLHELRGHTWTIMAIDVSYDSRFVVTASQDGTIRAWSLETGECLVNVSGHGDQVWGVAFAPDGTHFVSSGWDGRLRVWGFPDGALRMTTEAQKRSARLLRSVAYSPDQRYFASAALVWVELWDAGLARRLGRLLGHTSYVEAAVFSPDTKRIASIAANGYVRVWDLHGGRAQREIGRHHRGGESVAWSADGRWIASLGEDGRIVLYRADDESRVWERRTHGVHHWAGRLVFSPDAGVLAACGGGSDIEFWDIESGTLQRAVWAHDGRTGRLAWSGDGRTIASLGTDHALRIWDYPSMTIRHEIPLTTSDVVMGTAFDVAISPDGGLVAASAHDKAVRVWDLDTATLRFTLRGHEGFDAHVDTILFTPSGDRLLTSSFDGTIRVWCMRTGEGLRVLRGSSDKLRGMATTSNGRRVFSIGSDLRLWDIETGRNVLTLDEGGARIAISPDGHRLVYTALDGGVRILDGSPLE